MAIFNSILVFTCIISLANTAFSATFCVSDAVEFQAALTTSASNGEDDVVQIEQGTYVGNFVYASTESNGVTIEGGYTIGCTSQLVDPVNTVLDGDTSGSVLALSAPDQSAVFQMEGVTLQNGSASFNGGGGLYVKTNGGELTLISNRITENSTDDNGGGVYVDASTATMTENIITGNSGFGSYGGSFGTIS